MSRLEELISELCPDGVEYKKLGDIATITRGGSLQKKDFIAAGIPCIHYGQIYTRFGLFTDHALTFISEDVAERQKKAVTNDIIMAVTSENIEDWRSNVVLSAVVDAVQHGRSIIIDGHTRTDVRAGNLEHMSISIFEFTDFPLTSLL